MGHPVSMLKSRNTGKKRGANVKRKTYQMHFVHLSILAGNQIEPIYTDLTIL